MEANVDMTSSQNLQSGQSREILDVIDRLRRIGLQQVLGLPQLVVCGDQSSSKSSIPESTAELPFLRKEDLCTCFATHVVLRDAADTLIVVKIIPGKFVDARQIGVLVCC